MGSLPINSRSASFLTVPRVTAMSFPTQLGPKCFDPNLNRKMACDGLRRCHASDRPECLPIEKENRIDLLVCRVFDPALQPEWILSDLRRLT